MDTILYRYNPWWENNFKFSSLNLIDRPKYLRIIQKNENNKQIIFITGLRRIGKTSILKLYIKYLIEKKKINPHRILYVSLDDYLLLEYNILQIVDEFRKINNISFSEKIFIFLDEITYKEDYQIQLKNLVDSHEVKIFGSSSSSSLLKSNLSLLAGRYFSYEILPLDFKEYLDFKNISFSKADQHLVEKHFHQHLTTGGIPAYVLHENKEYLQQLVDDIIMKDIAALHNITNTRLLKEYFLLLMERSAKQMSINKIAKILSISPDTSRRYLDLFADTFLIHVLNRSGKTNEKILSPKKIYAADNGIRCLFTGHRDYGSLFENNVYLKIKHLSPEYIYQNGIEIDFLIKDILIECKYHQEELSGKQKDLFNALNFPEKKVVRNDKDVESLLEFAKR